MDVEWMTEKELNLTLNEMPPCFIKVDHEYPWELHDKFAEFVPAPDKIIPDGSKAPNLLPKTNYLCHIENLKKYVSLGVKITKIHAGVKFDEKACMVEALY